MGIGSRVVFAGARGDVEELLTVLDVLVSSSLQEGLFTVVLEAAAAGVPVVATRVSGNAEIVRDGVTGLLASRDDPRAMDAAIVSVLTKSEWGWTLAAAAQQDVGRRFSIRRIADQYADVYSKKAISCQ